MSNGPTSAVVISTYNWPWALERVLTGLARQTDLNFHVAIADDGSRDETREMLERFGKTAPFKIAHHWQEDDGFRKAQCLNKTFRATDAELFLFLDQDAVPPAHWVAQHRALYKPNRFVVGGYHRGEKDESQAITFDDINNGHVERLVPFRRKLHNWWYHVANIWSGIIRRKDRPRFMGLNYSVARDLLFRVNGHDEMFIGWGKEDSEMRTRFRQAGGQAVSSWHTSCVFHLWHPSNPTKFKKHFNQLRYDKIRKGELPWRCRTGIEDLRTDDEKRADADAIAEMKAYLANPDATPTVR
jgi:glycosyltransferase involved in cell wall biosynthesis